LGRFGDHRVADITSCPTVLMPRRGDAHIAHAKRRVRGGRETHGQLLQIGLLRVFLGLRRRLDDLAGHARAADQDLIGAEHRIARLHGRLD
jgi:hypothetical protein